MTSDTSSQPDGYEGIIGDSGEKSLETPFSVPPKCLSFSLSAPFAHFRKVETSQTRLTYGIPPRTTVAGIIAGILGFDSNAYYQLFDRSHSAVAITPMSQLREYNLPLNHRNTDTTVVRKAGDRRNLQIRLIQPNDETQRVNHSVIRNPTYRVDIWLGNQDVYASLRERLEAGRTYYTTSLGLSEFLASVEYHGESEPTIVDENTVAVSSVVPIDAGDVHLPPETTVTTERSPAQMERIETPLPNRKTTEFLTYHYRPDGEPLEVESQYAARIDDHVAIFS